MDVKVIQLTAQQLIRASSKKITKVCITDSLWGEFTSQMAYTVEIVSMSLSFCSDKSSSRI